jgi:formamidopyrimidine-DNA glycosylase
MPELPDLLYIQKYLHREVVGRSIVRAEVKESIVIRVGVGEKFQDVATGRRIKGIDRRGPFITLELSNSYDLVMNFMLMGRLQHQRAGEKSVGHLCFSLLLDDGTRLNFCDDQRMAKAYLVHHGAYAIIPRYDQQGINILSPEFTLESFRAIAALHTRKQVRVFINDHTILSAIGNAYADEILFNARIHPKTFVGKLSPAETGNLYHSIRSVMEWGIRKVEEERQPIHVKVRDHMRVRNHKGVPCPRCGTTIRREGVRGHDVFFCPKCQPASRKLFIDWKIEKDS